jgi:hypothetical protein
MFITTAGGGMLASSLLGGLLGGSSGSGSQTSTRTLDPRLANYVFGADGNSGLLSDVNGLYRQQMSQGGLNDIQRQGLGMQLQYLNSPQYQQGYQQMHNLGTSLMGGGVAGNPYNTGQRTLGQIPMMGGRMGGMHAMQGNRSIGASLPGTQSQQGNQMGFQYSQAPQAGIPNYAPPPVQQTQVSQADFEKWLADYLAKQAEASNRYGNGLGSDSSVGGDDGSVGGDDGPSGEA